MKKIFLIILGLSSITLAANNNSFSLFSGYQGTYKKDNSSYTNDYNIGTKLEFNNQYLKSDSTFQMEHLFNDAYSSNLNININTNNNLRYDIKNRWAAIGLFALNHDTKTYNTTYNFGLGIAKKINSFELSVSEINSGLNNKLYSGISFGLNYKNNNIEIKDTALQFLYGVIFKNADKTIPYTFAASQTVKENNGVAPIYLLASGKNNEYKTYQDMLFNYMYLSATNNITEANKLASKMNDFAIKNKLVELQVDDISLKPIASLDSTIPYRILLQNKTNLTYGDFKSKNSIMTQMDHIIQKVIFKSHENENIFSYLDNKGTLQKDGKKLVAKTNNFVTNLTLSSKNEYKFKDWVSFKSNLGFSLNSDVAYMKTYVNDINEVKYSIYNKLNLDTNIEFATKFTLNNTFKYTLEPKLKFDYNYNLLDYQGSFTRTHTLTFVPAVDAGISVPIDNQLLLNFNINLAPAFVGSVTNTNIKDNAPSDPYSTSKKISFSSFNHSEKIELKYTF